MIPIAGSIGIGAVWGWLAGGRDIQPSPSFQSLLSVVIITSVLAGAVFFFEAGEGLMLYLLSVAGFAILHQAWRWFLREHSKTRRRTEGGEVYS